MRREWERYSWCGASAAPESECAQMIDFYDDPDDEKDDTDVRYNAQLRFMTKANPNAGFMKEYNL